MYYSFGDYQLDIVSRKLCLKGGVVNDDEKIIKLLEILCSNYPEVADKQPLMDSIWPDQVVTDWSLSRLVSDTRQLLGDTGKDQGYIKTIRGRGFRLNIDVEETEGRVSLTEKTKLQKSRFKIVKPLALVASIVIVAVVLVLAFRPENLEAEPGLPFRVAILPVMSDTQAPIDEWIKYGIMSMASEQLGLYEALQTIPVATVINEVAKLSDSFYEQPFGQQQFEEICAALGCSHLISLKYKMNDEYQIVLSYQVLSHNYRSPISEFSQSDVIDTADMMLDYLASELIPTKTQRISLTDTYSDDSKANRDYAIGVHELLSGDFVSAKDYLKLAIQRKPDFFWAKAYLAEVEYRDGKFLDSIATIKKLKQVKLTDHQSYFLEHLHSNILYGEGKLEESLQISIKLLTNKFAMSDSMLKGNELLNAGSTSQALGKLKQAIKYLELSKEQYKIASYGPGEGRVLYNLGNVFIYASEKEKAINAYIKARELFKKYGMNGYALLAKHQIANTSIALGKIQYAEGELRSLLESYKKVGDVEGELTADADLVLVSLAKRDFKEGDMRIKRLLEKLEKTEYSYLKNHVFALAVRCNLELGDFSKAEEYYLKIDTQWNDIRPSFVFIPSYILHGKGDFKGALNKAKAIKLRLGDNWNDAHQKIFDQLKLSYNNGIAGKIDYD